ncbi:hypothetical protein HDU88_006994 [Geranomyces variabilis]|nr:hypothetical protein HDU88_006994 [Geranomyces variabilis]
MALAMPHPTGISDNKRFLSADRPLTDGWGSNLISTWEGMYEQSESREEVPDPFRKRDKIPRGSIDVRRRVSQRSKPASPSPSKAQKRAEWDWENTPVPTVSKSSNPPPSPSSSTTSGRKSIFTRQGSRREHPNGSSNLESPSRSGATTPTTRSPAPSPKPRASRRNEKERAFVAQALANLDVSRSTTSLPTPNATPRRPRRERSITDPATRALAASSDFIFMDTCSDVGTVVYVANPTRKTVKRLPTTQLDGERTISKTDLAGSRSNAQGIDQRVRFNALDPIRPGSFLPRIDVSDPLLARNPVLDPPAEEQDKVATVKRKKGKSAGCRCTIM